MAPTETSDLQSLLVAATPFLLINDVKQEDWCRVMDDPKDSRIGPWKYMAQYTVLNQTVWDRPGEVIYFVTDSNSRLRLVGQSMSKLKGRWRKSPMFDVESKKPLGKKALFHTSSWPAIEEGISSGDRPPFAVAALFRDHLESICKVSTGSLAETLKKPQTHRKRLSYHVESWVCSLDYGKHRLWNKQKVLYKD